MSNAVRRIKDLPCNCRLAGQLLLPCDQPPGSILAAGVPDRLIEDSIDDLYISPAGPLALAGL